MSNENYDLKSKPKSNTHSNELVSSQFQKRAKDGSFRGGARRGSGRPARVRGVISDAELIEFVTRQAGAATIDALFAQARAGNVAALARLTRIFYDGREQILKGRAEGDLFGAPDEAGARRD